MENETACEHEWEKLVENPFFAFDYMCMHCFIVCTEENIDSHK